jgi:hypothetical protein
MRRDTIDRLAIDRVFPARTLAAIRSWAERLKFSPAPTQGIWSTNAPHNPEISAPVIWPAGADIRARIRRLPGTARIYPTGTPADVVLRAIKRRVLASSLGERVNAISAGILASVLRYGPNTGLIWHQDAKHYALGFALYLHAAWEKDSGGILLVRDTRNPRTAARCIFPLANRLVIIPPWMEHSVTLVSGRTPGSVRLTLSGFFVRREQVDELLELERTLHRRPDQHEVNLSS